MHGMSVEIRLKKYLKNEINPRRVKKGLKPITWREYRKLLYKKADREIKRLRETEPRR